MKVKALTYSNVRSSHLRGPYWHLWSKPGYELNLSRVSVLRYRYRSRWESSCVSKFTWTLKWVSSGMRYCLHILVIHFFPLRLAHSKMWYPKNSDYSRSFVSAPNSQLCNSGLFSESLFFKNIFSCHLGKFKCVFRDSWKLMKAPRWSEIKESVLKASTFYMDL